MACLSISKHGGYEPRFERARALYKGRIVLCRESRVTKGVTFVQNKLRVHNHVCSVGVVCGLTA